MRHDDFRVGGAHQTEVVVASYQFYFHAHFIQQILFLKTDVAMYTANHVEFFALGYQSTPFLQSDV